MIKIQKWILKTFCNTYYDEMFKLLCKKETQIENLKKINENLREQITKLNFLMKGL